MTRLAINLGLAIAGLLVAAAAPSAADPAPRVTWADWVGDYTGALAWSSRCVSPGASRATIAVDAVDGALVADLTAAGGGLRALSLVEDDTGAWTAQQGDVTLALVRPAARANELELSVELASGCTLHARLRRPSTRLPACDALLAWGRIEDRCSKLAEPRLEEPAALAKERATWRAGARGVALGCAARVDRLELQLIDAGCAPVPDPQAAVRGPSCQRVFQLASRLGRCAAASPRLRDLSRAVLEQPTTSDDATTQQLLERRCEGLHDGLARLARHDRCPVE